MKIKAEILSKIIQGASVLLSIAGTAVAGKIEANHRSKMKNELKVEILKELSEKK